MSRTLAIGDVHGCARALVSLLEAVDPRPEDVVVTLGDYVDGGPCSREAIEVLLRLEARTRLVPILGNHDQLMLEARDDRRRRAAWIDAGGSTTLASYSPFGDRGRIADVPDEHWAFLERCRDAYETATHLFVHATAHPSLPLAEQAAWLLRWEKVERPPAHESGKTLVFGHVRQKSGLPLDLGHAIAIDTSASKGGWLTCLDVDRRWIWQANEGGRVREGSLQAIADII